MTIDSLLLTVKDAFIGGRAVIGGQTNGRI